MNKKICLLGLLFCLMTAAAEPALMETFHPTGNGYSFGVNFGIPVWKSIGLDFINQHSYLNCAGYGEGLYKKKCPDPMNRAYVYPPLTAFFFSWSKLISIEKAIGLWSLFVFLGCFGAAYFWLWFLRKEFSVPGSHSRTVDLCLAGLFALSYPAIFSFERGNNDVLVLILATFAGVSLAKQKWLYLGASLSLALFLKIYPVYLWAAFTLGGFALVFAGIFLRRSQAALKAGGLLLTGQFLSAGILFLMMYKEYKYYLTAVLPQWMTTRAAGFLTKNVHSLTVDYGAIGPWIAWMLWALSAGCMVHWLVRWAVDSDRQSLRGVLFSFTFISALMVYFANVCFDYNLILMIPLFCFLATLKDESFRFEIACGLFFLLLGYGLPRGAAAFLGDRAFLNLEIAGLCFLAFAQLRMISSRKLLS